MSEEKNGENLHALPYTEFEGVTFAMVEIRSFDPPKALLIAGHLYQYMRDIPELSDEGRL